MTIQQILNDLCKYEQGRNHLVEGSLEHARKVIRDGFERASAVIETQDYDVDGVLRQNITASFGVENEETVIVAAHYDTVYGSPGADDNASGIAVLLRLAEYLGGIEKLPYRIDLVALDTEEPPFFGSTNMGSIVNAIKYEEQHATIKLVIVMDMLGYYSDEEVSNETYFFDLINLLTQNNIRTNQFLAIAYLDQEEVGYEFVTKLQRASELPIAPIKLSFNILPFELSDCYSYMDCSFPVVLLTDTGFVRNPNYHQSTDSVDTIDFEKLDHIAKGLFTVLTSIF